VIVVEGFFDALAVPPGRLFPAVVALMGSTLSRCQADLLTTHFDQVLLMLDGDDAGRHGTAAITAALGWRIGVVPIVVDEGTQPDQLKPVAIQHLLEGQVRASLPESRRPLSTDTRCVDVFTGEPFRIHSKIRRNPRTLQSPS
jgi:hypothetical protein